MIDTEIRVVKRIVLNILALLSLLHFVAGYNSATADICVSDPLKVKHIQGYVVAAWKGGEDPVPNAEVELQGFHDDEWQSKFKVATDERGFFRIENVPSGKYTMLVKANHFKSFGVEVRLRASKSSPEKEIIVRLGIPGHDCGAARMQKLKRE